MTGVLIRRPYKNRDAHREKAMCWQSRDFSSAAASQGMSRICRNLQKLEGGRRGLFLRDFRRTMVLLTP